MGSSFILNADDLGKTKSYNKAVLEAYDAGLLKSASIVANGDAFDEAVEIVLPKCPALSVGIHLNITDGYSLCTDVYELTNPQGIFNNNFYKIWLRSRNKKDELFYEQLEREFRRQIETVLSKTKVSHIDSDDNIHAIPPLFDMVCRLAAEYRIPAIRTHRETFYFVPDICAHFNKQYFKNLFTTFILNIFTRKNEATAYKYRLKTNDFIIGNLYKGMNDSLTVSYGISAIKYDNVTVEAFIHPCRYEEGTIDGNFKEFMLAKNPKLKNKIEKLGFEITNYAKKEI